MTQPTPPATALAILFADVSGSTRLYETLGDEAAQRMITKCLTVLRQVTRQQGGNVADTIGDEVMSTFPDASTALQAARVMQQMVTEEAAANRTPLAIRVGVHFGPVLLKNKHVFGDVVNVAARMVALAKAGQIITTHQTVNAVAPALRDGTRHIDRVPVKGKQEEMDIYEVIWREDDLTRMDSFLPPPPTPQARLCLRFGEQEVELNQQRPVATIGRGSQNDLVVSDEFASRLHARVEYRRGKFILLDQSTNGTFVLTADGKALRLRREEVPLQGAGVISLGHALGAESPQAIHFLCEP